MKPKRIILLVASHLLVIVAAVLLAKRSPSLDSVVSSDAPGKQQETSKSLGSEKQIAKLRLASQWRGSEFARAWKAVRTAKLTTKERVKTQRDLLEQWAKVDLTAAIEAALGEEWDGDNSMYFDVRGPYLDVFGDAFAENPEESWEIIRSKRFGLATGMLRNVWIETAGFKMPVILAERFGELSWRDRKQALEAFSDGSWELNVKEDHAKIQEQILNALIRLPTDVVSDADILPILGPELSSGEDIATLKTGMLRSLDNDPRMARVMALALGSRLASSGATDIIAQIQNLPPALKVPAAWGAFDNFENKRSLDAASVLVECEAWDRLEDRNTVFQMQRLCKDGQSEEVADWATGMPFRKETSELFYRCVETYLRENMQDSREWIAGIETPEWRDRAYAEYSQQALNAKGDPEASRWALNQIKDPSFKSQAESWRAEWERRNVRKPD